MKLLKNTHIEGVCLAALVLLISGCTASSSATSPLVAESPGPTYACEPGDNSWNCRSSRPTLAVRPTLEPAPAEVERTVRNDVPWWRIRIRGRDDSNTTPRRTAVAAKPKQEPRQVAKVEEPKRERRGFFGIRIRGRNAEPASQPEPTVVRREPAPVVVSSPEPTASRVVLTPRQPASTPSAASTQLSEKPTSTPAPAAPVIPSQTTNPIAVAPTPNPSGSVVVMQVPTQNANESSRARRSVSPTVPDVTLDGLGGDYDYAVQLAAFTNYGLSSDFLNSYPSLDLMRVKTLSNGKTFYIVLAGTFESKQLAAAQSQMLTSTYALDEPYIRTVKSIRNTKIN